jgi:hypothetical protein
MKSLSTLALALCFATPAFARDSSHLVCTGYESSKPGPDNYGFAVQFDESRGPNGDDRLEVLSTVWAGALYQGSRVNTKDDFGQNGTITMVGADGKSVFYKGTYNVVQNPKTHAYTMQLKGALSVDPTDTTIAPDAISTTLSCVNISN